MSKAIDMVHTEDKLNGRVLFALKSFIMIDVQFKTFAYFLLRNCRVVTRPLFPKDIHNHCNSNNRKYSKRNNDNFNGVF